MFSIFSITKLIRDFKSVQEKIDQAPVVITKSGHEGFVIMTKSDYERLVKEFKNEC